MAKLIYKRKDFAPAALLVIQRANAILVEYEQQGYDLTLRQLYYQFVSRGLIPNSDREYKKLGSIVNDARLAGMIDWKHIVDRTRNLKKVDTWDDPADIVESAASSFRIDKWADQDTRVEVWIEKDALLGVIERPCRALAVPYFSCRGYTSQSEMWSASQRMLAHIGAGKSVRILHLGDHDPSGIDMTRDIEERIYKFLVIDHWRNKMEGSGTGVDASIEHVHPRFQVDRLALNMDQIELYDPPPNPAKLSDSRGRAYIEEYGDESWELDALEPTVIGELIEDAVVAIRDEDLWDEAVAAEDEHRAALKVASDRWPEVAEFLTGE